MLLGLLISDDWTGAHMPVGAFCSSDGTLPRLPSPLVGLEGGDWHEGGRLGLGCTSSRGGREEGDWTGLTNQRSKLTVH